MPMSDEFKFMTEGVIRCTDEWCRKEWKCHLEQWGHPSTTGYCDNCGQKTLKWFPEDWEAWEVPDVDPTKEIKGLKQGHLHLVQ